MASIRGRKKTSEPTAAHRVLALGPELRIGNVRTLHATLSEALASGEDITLDASAVQSADTAGLQLLYAFVRDSKRRGQAVTWREPNAVLRRDAGLLDLDAALGLGWRR